MIWGPILFTCWLLIYQEQGDASYDILFKKQIPVKLGEGGINAGRIMPEPYQRGLDALQEFKAEIERLGVTDVVAFATSAIRGAANGDEFITKVRDLTGIDIQKIDGNREATLIFEGVKQSLTLADETILVMDIGGGSVEFIIGNREKILWKHSFLLGAARLIENYHRHDPISANEVESLKKYLEEALEPLWQAAAKFPFNYLVGSAGSFDSVVELITEQLKKTPPPIGDAACEILIEDYNRVHEVLLKSTVEERRQMKGLVGYRVEMMVVASVMIDYVLRRLHINKLICSAYSLKEGMLSNSLHG